MAKTGRPPHSPAQALASLEARFWPKVQRAGAGECWPWRGSVVAGYGTIATERGPKPATHALWRITHGFWPENGQFVCHRCDNPPCVNPAHLWLGSAAENTQDASRKLRLGKQQIKCCPRGHPYPPPSPGLVRRCDRCTYSRRRLRAAIPVRV